MAGEYYQPTLRRYTVNEIEDLRRVLINKQTRGKYEGYDDNYRSPWVNMKDAFILVEEQVRTHMIAGHDAQDLINSERQRDAQLETQDTRDPQA